jgi:hypothetical protein
MGIKGLPAGQAQQTFPIVPFAGTNAPTGWGGTTANLTLAENYTAMDNLQWTVGKHSFTFGGQVAWMLYNTYSATGAGATTPFVLASAVTETAKVTAGSYTPASGTGLAYASFLLGQIDSTTGKNAAGSTFTFTDYSGHPGYGARFRAISPYIQDNWKITSNLTLDLGLRYDYYPSVREVKDDASFFDPNLANPITGMNGALNFAGHGAGTCNCDSPVNNYMKNIAPRLGLAYQLNPKTVIRSSYGIMFTHGDAVGGLASTLGTLGFSNAPPMTSANDATAMTGLLSPNALDASGNPITGAGLGVVPTYTAPLGVASGNGYGTGNTKTPGYTGGPSTFNYDDPYLGGRAPEYINWSFGIQRQLTNALALSATYVGSEGHFLQLDSNTARGLFSNQLDPKYLVLGSHLGDQGGAAGAIGTDCAAGGAVVTAGFSCNATALNLYATNQSLSTLLKPYPFQSVSDSFGYVGNANYHSLQVMANMRAWHGLTVNANYSWSRAIDDGGTFRTGYAIPAGTLANHPNLSYKADAIERTVSTSNQPQHFVLTTVWDWPFGKAALAQNSVERAILGGFKFSGIYQAYSGSPLAITESSTQTNQAQSSTAPPILNPNFSGKVRQNGKKWGEGATTSNYNTISYITPSTGTTVANAVGPFMNPVTTMLSSYNYQFSDAPRTAPYGLTGPGNYQLDLAMVRSFPLHFMESAKLNFRAEWYNVTNHTQFAVASTAVGNASFGQVTSNGSANRKAAQFSARIEF